MRKVPENLLKTSLAAALVLGAVPAAAVGPLAFAFPQAAEAATSGTWNGLSYDIDDAGTLTFHAGTLTLAEDEDLAGENAFSDTAAFAKVRSVRADGTVVLPEDSSDLFSGASNLRSVDLSNFDTSQVTSLARVFDSCARLTSVDLTGLDTSKVEDMSYLFSYCTKLKSIDITGLSTSSLVYADHMFDSCATLTALYMPRFYTSKVESMREMFEDCSALKTLDISGVETGGVEDFRYLFEGCDALVSVKLGTGFTFNGSSGARQCSLPEGNWKSSADGKVYKAGAVPNNVGATYTYVPDPAARKLAKKKTATIVEKSGSTPVTFKVKATKVSKKEKTVYVALRKVSAGKKAVSAKGLTAKGAGAVSAMAAGKKYRASKGKLPKTLVIPEPRWHAELRYTVVYVQIAPKALWKAKNVKTVRVPSTVSRIGKRAFGKSPVKTLQLRTRLLTGKRVKGSLQKSRVAKVTVSVGSKKKSRKVRKKYAKAFAKKNSGRAVKVV